MKVITQVIIILILMVVGYISKKANLIHREAKKDISDLLLYIALPAATVSAFNKPVSAELMKSGAIILVFGFAAHIVAALFAKVAFSKEKHKTKEVMSFITVFSNCAFMGYPVMQSLFGDVGIFYASIYLLSFNLFVWTYGQMIYTKKTDLSSIKKALLNTGTLSVIVGGILLISPIKLPEIGSTVLTMLGNLTTPLAMIVIGATLAECDFKVLFRGRQMYVVTAIRLILIPVFWMGILHLMGIDNTLVKACVMLVAMPAASNAAMFAEKFDGDTMLASKAVVFSTVASMVTIPLFALLS